VNRGNQQSIDQAGHEVAEPQRDAGRCPTYMDLFMHCSADLEASVVNSHAVDMPALILIIH
jgi:hypothetical protein